MLEASGVFRMAENMANYFDINYPNTLTGVKSSFNP